MEHEIDKFLYENGEKKMSSIKTLDDDKKIIILSRIRDNLHRDYGEIISDKVIDETKYLASEAISIIDAWIYRDWQDAIGDSILINDSSSTRQYKTIGYGDFEEIAINDKHKMNLWYKRLSSIFQEMNIENTKSDMRVEQLRGLYAAVANLLLAIDRRAPKRMRGMISKETIAKAADVTKGPLNGKRSLRLIICGIPWLKHRLGYGSRHV